MNFDKKRDWVLQFIRRHDEVDFVVMLDNLPWNRFEEPNALEAHLNNLVINGNIERINQHGFRYISDKTFRDENQIGLFS